MSDNINPVPGADAPKGLSEAEKAALVRSTHRSDLRRIIGAIFLLYGVLVTGVGIADPAADTALTGGIAINLWTGISMLVAGGLFFLWDRLAPVPAEDIIQSAEAEAERAVEGEGHLPE